MNFDLLEFYSFQRQTAAMPCPTNDKSMASLEMPESGFTCFATRVEVTARRRAKLDPQRREKVKGVRRRGACLRCRILKIPVRVPSHRRILS